MMCEHEFVEAAIMVCKKCCKTMRVLEMEERLDAANANNKALREENELLRHKAAGHDATMLQTELAAANARIAELTAERQRDALDGQAALDEANSRITSYEQQFGEYCKGAKSDVDYWKKRAEKAEAKAKQLIKKLTYNTPSFRDGKCDEELLTIDENELVPLKSCMCDRLKQAEAKLISHAPDGHQYSNAQFIAMRQKAEQAEAQNKLMRELLVEIQSYAETYVDLNPRMKHIIDCAKAALEDKP